MSQNTPDRQPAPGAVVDVDDDVDDLDDLVDQFSTLPPPSRNPAPARTPGTATPSAVPGPNPSSSSANAQAPQPTTDKSTANAAAKAPFDNPEGMLPEDFEAALQESMEEWLKELGNPNPGGEAAAVQKAFEEMLVNGMDVAAADAGLEGTSSSGGVAPDVEKSFQDTIKEAMNKMKENEEAIKAAGGEDDALAKLLSSFNLGDLASGGGEGADGMQSMLETMMQQLMSKDILYEPLKELSTKFPEYLEKNRDKLSEADRTRYEQQSAKVSEIVARFEASDYSDDSAEIGSEILNLMNEMQSFGAPPKEIMGEMPPGMDFGEDGMPSPENCSIM